MLFYDKNYPSVKCKISFQFHDNQRLRNTDLVDSIDWKLEVIAGSSAINKTNAFQINITKIFL